MLSVDKLIFLFAKKLLLENIKEMYFSTTCIVMYVRSIQSTNKLYYVTREQIILQCLKIMHYLRLYQYKQLSLYQMTCTILANH